MHAERSHSSERIPDRINALLVGAGAREHALGVGLTRSPRLGDLFLTHPGNPGLDALGRPVDCPFEPAQPFRLQRFCERERINLVVIGPEAPLAAGLADALAAPDRAIFGPTRDAARLEADKAWTKQLLRGASIPTAESHTFIEPESAIAYIESRESPQVIKASGLAAGKGVIIPENMGEAIEAINRIMVERAFGEAGARVVIEERLKGPEASVLAFVDGRTIFVLEPCQDHKRLLEGDEGPNTGGMGAFCPTSVIDDAMMERIERDILVPTIDTLRREDIEFRGVLYAGLMLTHAGPKVLEFNVRFGDPECQPLMARFHGDLAETLYRVGAGSLADASFSWDPRTACTIVLASRGYPAKPETGDVITGVDEAEELEDVAVHFAGAARNASGDLVTSGGRVLSVTALGDSLEVARERALTACEKIHFKGMQLRRDIGAAPARSPG